jgi:mono/diheme cytochrome c family protein
MKKITAIYASALLTLLLTGCSETNEFTPTEGMSAADIFSSTCQSCHGEKGAGKFGFILAIAGSDDSLQEIAAKIHEGGSIMPAFPNISDSDRLAIATYIKGL